MFFGKTEVLLKKGDITTEEVDVIVNAANSGLLGGGGVDGAIHRAGGSSILEECRKILEEKGKCPPGEAVITTAGKMLAKNVVHTVGPIWHGGQKGEPEILRKAYMNSLRLAEENGAQSIAFPSISTGIYGYPIEKAVLVAIDAIREFAHRNFNIKEVRFIVFSDHDFTVFEQALIEIKSKG